MVSSRRGGQRKQPRGSRLCDWQLSITRQQDESHPLEEALQWREREGGGGGGGGGGRPSLPYLSFSFTAPLLSPCLVIALTLTFHSPALSPQTHVNNSRYQADPQLQTLSFLPGNQMYSSLLFAIFKIYFSLIVPTPSIRVFLPPGRENEFHAGCCSNIYSVHNTHMHFHVYCQPSVWIQIGAVEDWLKPRGLSQVMETQAADRETLLFP